jgi:M6 family metalloprotease-like protein
MKNFILLLLIFILASNNIFGHLFLDTVYSCVNSELSRKTTRIGGLYLPSTGTIRVLIIFVQFSDDDYDIKNSSWPKWGSPINPINSTRVWIDQKWSANPTRGSLTDYFNEMSFNSLHFIGDTLSIVTPHSRQWYLHNNKIRYDIHKEIIQQLDQRIDFSKYDNWTYNSFYNFTNQPDNKIEMVFFVWRNIAHEYSLNQQRDIYKALDMGTIADIGHNVNVLVDNGERQILTYFFQGGGGGATITDYFSENAFRFIIHEYAHYLEGDNFMHSGFGFWGMLSAWGIKSFVINAFEREILGWGNPVIMDRDSSRIVDATLRDFITTGNAYKLIINSKTDEYFYIENHQNVSYWENHGLYGNVEKGIYIIRQDGQYGDQLQLISAEGRYDWQVKQLVDNPWGDGQLPVFKQLEPDRTKGYDDLQLIPWSWGGLLQNPAPIHFTENPLGHPQLDIRFEGDGKDAFRLGYNEIWSPYSNPSSQSANRTATPYGIKLNSLTFNDYSITIYVNTSQNAPPAKPQNIKLSNINRHLQLSWDSNIAPDIIGYNIFRRANTGDFEQIAFVPKRSNNFYSDTETSSDITDEKITYFIKAKDKDSLLSIGSDTVSLMARLTNLTSEEDKGNNYNFSINQNYPNPFNPTTKIKYSIPNQSLVTIKVFDTLGREIETIVNEEKGAGTYEITWNAFNLPSGVYFYMINAGDFIHTKKMVLLK